MKKNIIAGNWKMNNGLTETIELIAALKPLVKDAEAEVAVCVPFTDLAVAKKALKGSKIKLGAQNIHWADKGAFTGEISGAMLKELKVDYVIIGHSERRQYFGETDATVNARLKAALKYDIKPIVCVGETLAEREAGKVEEVLIRQTEGAFADIDKASLKNIVVAYEPVWAIGTGKTATSDEANDTIAIIRKKIQKLYGSPVAKALRIQYGGSMNAKNAKELMAKEQIDGGLIGGASLKAVDFSQVVNYNA
ncbi:MAG: triose-phosphate isomerase [Christensenellaceae bacterium]|jgi:triosephosphate isomerase|nr:triose-phosphate isomerase [Christensenellaceae bacterium]